MADNGIDKKVLSKLKGYDETQLLDNIEDINYLKTLMFDEPDSHQSILSQKHIKLFQKLNQIKCQNKEIHQTALWDDAIELEQTLWHAGVVLNDMLFKLYQLLSTNPELGYDVTIDVDDEDDDGF